MIDVYLSRVEPYYFTLESTHELDSGLDSRLKR